MHVCVYIYIYISISDSISISIIVITIVIIIIIITGLAGRPPEEVRPSLAQGIGEPLASRRLRGNVYVYIYIYICIYIYIYIYIEILYIESNIYIYIYIFAAGRWGERIITPSGTKGVPRNGVASNKWFDRVLLSILYMFRTSRRPMFKPPSLGPPELPSKTRGGIQL